MTPLQIRAAAERMCMTTGTDGEIVDLPIEALNVRDLDGTLGLRSSKLPRFHPGVPPRVLYRVQIPGAPATCAVIVGYANDGTIQELFLRRDHRPQVLDERYA